ncbi:ATP-binding protein [Streptomyces sp. NPDC057620]|uniref:ATP-binding protein n=1 Tax=Streptomyces sp. NPDC057620 TaxID=3346185 RepID=UPI00367D218A
MPVTARAVDLTELVVSELVTNARVHALGPAVLELRVTDTAVEVSVQDSVPVPPPAHAVDPRRVGRHGEGKEGHRESWSGLDKGSELREPCAVCRDCR